MKTGFFEEKEGVRSMTRLNSFILMLFFVAFNLLYLSGGSAIDMDLAAFDLMLLLGIFTPKVLQKLVEVKK